MSYETAEMLKLIINFSVLQFYKTRPPLLEQNPTEGASLLGIHDLIRRCANDDQTIKPQLN